MNSICVQELLDLSVFKCKCCNKRCQYPVMMGDKEGNYCITCLEELQPNMKKENEEINGILKKLNVPCRFNENGCGVCNNIVDITSHEIECEFREKMCPLKQLNQCNVIPKIMNYASHFINHHKQNVISSELDTFDASFNIEQSMDDIIRLLIVNNEYFLLHIQHDVDNTFLLALFLCGDHENIKNYNCSFEHNEIKEFNLLHESDISLPLKRKNAVVYDFPVEDNSEAKLKIIITANSYMKTIKNNELLNNLNCPICVTYMYEEIHQCTSGHSICKSCFTRLQRCPTCTAPFNATRNYTLESLTSILRCPCRHEGCNIYFSKKKILNHEDICPFKLYSCPFQEPTCDYTGLYESLGQHLEVEHSKTTIRSNFVERIFAVDNITTKETTIMCFNSIFHCYVKKNMDVYNFICKYIGPKRSAKRFVFEVELINQQNNSNKMLVRNSWRYVDTNELVIEIHNHNMLQYSTQQSILLQYRILKCSAQHF
ncbi:e3 ubiquitin-protein ligase siah2 [Holotrichia oblita]|uniref:E3 ubiquitin-protein ligase siah2 n=1 Tax=Holotrichia oblita TaxID=644536 RepID=A0ACB9SQ40_HOLOL|nr:e3 ubiquitin-protein ligase siah2 [Holotrichia oblita]